MVKITENIVEELYNREVPLCFVCNENPLREGTKTCSPECSKKYRAGLYYKKHQGEYNRKYYQRNKHRWVDGKRN